MKDFEGLEKRLKKYKCTNPGISIMVIKDGNLKFKRELGFSNLELKVPISEKTAYNIASISKQFTAMGIMILNEKGLISYDDYITNYLKELKAFNKVTIENLLSHTSGIINYYEILTKLNKTAFNINNNDVYELLKGENLLFKPGSHFDYSNSNYVLLAIIIEKVIGLSYKKFIEKNIFKEIGMDNSYVFDETKPVIKNRAYGYKKANNKYYCDYQEALTVGDGGIFSTLNDLYIWDQILYTDRLVSKETLDLAFSTKYDLEEDYGFGWSLDESNKKIWHTGLDAGFRSMITRYLKEKLTVIILSNSSVCTYKKRQRITDFLFNTYKN